MGKLHTCCGMFLSVFKFSEVNGGRACKNTENGHMFVTHDYGCSLVSDSSPSIACLWRGADINMKRVGCLTLAVAAGSAGFCEWKNVCFLDSVFEKNVYDTCFLQFIDWAVMQNSSAAIVKHAICKELMPKTCRKNVLLASKLLKARRQSDDPGNISCQIRESCIYSSIVCLRQVQWFAKFDWKSMCSWKESVVCG